MQLTIMSLNSLLHSINEIGILPNDDGLTVNRKRFVVYVAIAMSMGGILWGTVCCLIGKYFQSTIPFAYVILSIVNISYFRLSHNFKFVQLFQTSISLLLPFLTQFVLGGFNASGGIMLWSLLSLIVSLSYSDSRTGFIWLTLYTLLVSFSLYFDSYFIALFPNDYQEGLITQLFALNILVVSFLIFLLVIFFVRENYNSYRAIQNTTKMLIQSEKLAALGQLSAGIAHEINTPLGAIKAIASETAHMDRKLFNELLQMCEAMSDDEFKILCEIIHQHRTDNHYLSTREERQKVTELSAELSSLGIENSRNLAVKLVFINIYRVTEELKQLIGPHFDQAINILYMFFMKEKNSNTASTAVEKASRIVRALKMYLHTSEGNEPEPFDVEESINTVLTIYHNQIKHGVQVELDFQPLPKVSGYVEQINQVWTNLIINACQAMEFNGTLSIATKKVGETILVSIADTGIGIAPEVGDKIFDAFYSTKKSGEGSGLGLDIVKKIVDKHHGRIYYESEQGKGTTFYVELPILSKNLNS